MEGEKRSVPRVPINAQVRLRAVGSDGCGVVCRVHDSSAEGIRFRCEEPIGMGWEWVEVLKSSGRPLDEPLQARVVRTARDADGNHEIGCTFK